MTVSLRPSAELLLPPALCCFSQALACGCTYLQLTAPVCSPAPHFTGPFPRHRPPGPPTPSTTDMPGENGPSLRCEGAARTRLTALHQGECRSLPSEHRLTRTGGDAPSSRKQPCQRTVTGTRQAQGVPRGRARAPPSLEGPLPP